MEMQPFESRRGGKKGTRASCAKDVSPTLKAKTFPSDKNHEDSVAPQSEQSNPYEDSIDSLQPIAALYATGTVVEQFRAGAGHPEQYTEVSFELLTAQTLRECEVKQANCVGFFDNTNDVSSGHLINRQAGIPHPRRHQTYVDDIAHFDMSPSSLPIYQEQEEHENKNFTSMGKIDDFEYKAARPWSIFTHQEQVIDMPKDDARGIDTQCANLDTTSNLTAWGNDLAGIGGHFSEPKCQGYASAEDFVVEYMVTDAQQLLTH